MKKLTSGIFATLMVLVSASAARADIASTEYVDGQLNTKESVASRVESTNYNPMATNKEQTYPTVATAERIADEVVRNQVGDLNTTLGNYEQVSNKVQDGMALNSLSMDQKKENYPSVQAAEDIAHNAMRDELQRLNLVDDSGNSQTEGFEQTANKVQDGTSLNSLTPDQKKENYPSVQAAEDIAHNAMHDELQRLNLVDNSGNSQTDGFEKTANRATSENVNNMEVQNARDTYYTTVGAVDGMVRQVIDENMERAGFTRDERGNLEIPYELSANKANDQVIEDSQKSVKFPTVALTEQMIHNEVDRMMQDASSDYQAKSSILDALSNVDTSVCMNGECVLRYNAMTKTFELEPIVRGGTTAPVSE